MNAKNVVESFLKSTPVKSLRIPDHVVIPPKSFDGNINCLDCHFTYFTATCAQIYGKVELKDCKFDHLDFYSTYFLKGLTIDGCVVSDRITFQSGGHNAEDHPFIIRNTRFESFVDFEDCWFTGPARFENVVFAKGTNLLGNQNNPMAVSFDFEPEIVNIEGTLDANTYVSPAKNH